ncbi:MAG: hypothetical protein RIR04_2392, partial [Pseudomonadota bacterium]
RPFLADPDFVIKAASGRRAEIAPCIACNQACLDHTFSGKLTSCLINPRACHETVLTYAPTLAPKRIGIVGAGPAGMMTALVAAERGHKVVLFDRAQHVGGQLNLARKVPGKEEFDGMVDWFGSELVRRGVETRLGREADLVDLTGFDEVVIATGVAPRELAIEGHELAMRYSDVLQGAPVGQRVAIIGAGGIGFDVAEFLVGGAHSATLDLALWRKEWGVGDPAETAGGLATPAPEAPAREVWLLQRKAEKPGRGLGKTTGWIHRAALHAKGVKMIGGVTYQRITPAGLEILRDGVPELIEVDNVILCAGQLPERGLAERLIAAGIAVHIIGGADVASELDAKRAIDQGARLAAGF